MSRFVLPYACNTILVSWSLHKARNRCHACGNVEHQHNDDHEHDDDFFVIQPSMHSEQLEALGLIRVLMLEHGIFHAQITRAGWAWLDERVKATKANKVVTSPRPRPG